MIINIIKLDCKRCGHIWVPTQEDIRICPKCKSASWDKPKEIKENKDESNNI